MALIKHYWQNIYRYITSIGYDSKANNERQKRTKLLNIFCFFWLLIEFGSIIAERFQPEKSFILFITHFTNIIGILSVLYLQHLKKYIAAIFIFFFFVFYSNFMFSNYIIQGKFLEFTYMIAPSFMLLFTNNKYLIFSTFIIALSLFIIPNYYFNHYSQDLFGSSYNIFTLFAIIFILVNYFKHENIKNEKALKLEQEKIANLNKKQAQFFINVSHEIRTPLTLIKGQINKLSNSSIDDNHIKLIEKGLTTQTNKIKKIVDDVIDLAKMKTDTFGLNLVPINFLNLVTKLYTSFEPLFKQKQVELTFNTILKSSKIFADTIFLERALNNILLNALKYTDKHGAVTLQLTENNSHYILNIKDTGIGIPEEEIESIFNRFYQVDNDINRAKGSGVGLAFSKEIINQLDGTISIISKINVGSTFVISIPKVLNETTKDTDKFFTRKTQNTKAQHVVLIVDDSYDMRQYLNDILTDYKCIEAENGIEALKIIDSQKIDFVLTDYMMPKMDGLKLTEHIKKEHKNIPVLMLTARTDNFIKLSSLRIGIDDYLNKPFEEEELKIRIKNVLNNAIKRKEYNSIEHLTPETKESVSWIKNIEKHIYKTSGKKPLTQINIAEQFNMSTSTLYRKIKSETGLTPNEFITEIKLQKAKHLIEKGKISSLKHITLEAGFKHSSYFSKKYYERFGSKPKL